MVDFGATIRQLQQQRQELLDQVAAIDRAIAALTGSDRGVRTGLAASSATSAPPAPAPPRKRRQFALSEEHKRKMVEGRRRAREARAEAAPASGASAGNGLGLPRLVKHPVAAPAATTDG